MKRETSNWLAKSKEDFKTAEILQKNKRFAESAFFLQQSIEKSLKALLIEKSGHFPKIHDLVSLGRRVQLPEDLLDYCKEISPAYSYTRYPNVAKTSKLEKKLNRFFPNTQKILKWIKRRL